MSAENVWMSSLSLQKKVGLVQKITERTKQGKIIWQKTGQGIAANLQGKLKMNFVEAPSPGLFGTLARWVIFTVRGEDGSEILKVENKTSAVPAPVPGSPSPEPLTGFVELLLGLPDPLVKAVTDLHNLVSAKAKGDIEKAIDILDTL